MEDLLVHAGRVHVPICIVGSRVSCAGCCGVLSLATAYNVKFAASGAYIGKTAMMDVLQRTRRPWAGYTTLTASTGDSHPRPQDQLALDPPRANADGTIARVAAMVMGAFLAASQLWRSDTENRRMRPWRLLPVALCETSELEDFDTGAAEALGATYDINPNNIRLIEQIDDGTMGQVWLAELVDDSGNRTEKVAVKVMSTPGKKEDRELLEREIAVLCRASARCHHVTRMYGVSRARGKFCIVMKLYKTSLAKLMEAQGGTLSVQQIQKYGKDICKGLVELHEQGIIMQDLKPGNVLIDAFDNAVLADFGVSSIVERTIGSCTLTSARGTPSYMAPECWEPSTKGGVTEKADLWSLACMCIELHTGTPPWKGLSIPSIARRVVDGRQRPAIPADLPPTLRMMLERCLEHKAELRPSARECLCVFLTEWHLDMALTQPAARHPQMQTEPKPEPEPEPEAWVLQELSPRPMPWLRPAASSCARGSTAATVAAPLQVAGSLPMQSAWGASWRPLRSHMHALDAALQGWLSRPQQRGCSPFPLHRRAGLFVAPQTPAAAEA